MKKKQIDLSKSDGDTKAQRNLRDYLSSEEAHCTLQAILRESDELVDSIERGRRLDSVLFRTTCSVS
ncbi:MAG: hypothetical protein ACYDHG_02235 [Desulfomonilaceae bacterium]